MSSGISAIFAAAGWDGTEAIPPQPAGFFFRVRFDHLTPTEKLFLRRMALLGNQACRIGDLAELLQVKVGSLSPRRAALIQKGMIYSPSHGDLDFTVPLFGEFMRRQIPAFLPK